MTYRVYPDKYCPAIASGPPDPYYIKIGAGWTPEETERMRILEAQSQLITVADKNMLPIGRWHMLVD